MWSHVFGPFLSTQISACSSVNFVALMIEGDIGVCGIAVLNNFSCGISVILILNCGIAVFSKPAGCAFLAFWTV